MLNKEKYSIEKAASAACASLYPEKSKARYHQAYQSFMKWCSDKGILDIEENVMLAFFLERSKTLSPATLWSVYSMLKLAISLERNEDISKYKKLIAFIKRKNDGYEPRKSKVFTKEQITDFLVKAPNQSYLAMKVIAIMGVAGACRTDEIYKMKVSDIELKQDIAIVQVPDTKNNMKRRFVISDDIECHVLYVELLQRYVNLRPKNAQDARLFYRYERGRCVNQVIGKHTISKVPYEIARFLKLNEANQYTGHAFRRTSATLLATSSGVDVLDLKRHGGWKSNTVAEGYIADSYINKVEISKKILHGNAITSTVTNSTTNAAVDETEADSHGLISATHHTMQISSNNIPSVHFSNCSNCSITFNINK